MFNAAIKTDGKYTLKIVHDKNTVNPRKEYENFGKIVCWSNRYPLDSKYDRSHLGDKHEHVSPYEFLEDIVKGTVPEIDIINFIKDGKARDLKLEYSTSNREWILSDYSSQYNEWRAAVKYPEPLEAKSKNICADIFTKIEMRDLMELVKLNHLIMPLYQIYQSGITVSAKDSQDEWEDNQVGWIYASREAIAKKYGDASPENIEKACALLESEVDLYDCYLRGQCYGFILFKDGKETDSSWGFVGRFKDAVKAIREYLPEEAVPLADSAEYGDREYGAEDDEAEM